MRNGALATACLLAVVACGRGASSDAAPPTSTAPRASAPASAPTPATSVAPTPPEKPMDPSLFTRDQKRISGLVAWREGAVAVMSPFMVVDAARGVAAPLTIPGC